MATKIQTNNSKNTKGKTTRIQIIPAKAVNIYNEAGEVIETINHSKKTIVHYK